MAYALSLDPKLNLQAALPRPVAGPNAVTMTFSAARRDLGYVIQTSRDLHTWVDEEVSPSDLGPDDLATAEMLRDSASRFIRLLVAARGIRPDMALIPAGHFDMGDSGDGNWEPAVPVHSVYVSSFLLDRFEVTQAHWVEVGIWGFDHGYRISSGYGLGPRHPVLATTWYDAVKWCNARSEKEGLTPVYYTDSAHTTVYRTGSLDLSADQVNWSADGYRLPTEAEWEKAARGGVSGREFPWGNTAGPGDANYRHSDDPYDLLWERDHDVETTPVGFYNGTQSPPGRDRANGYGLYDMAGNGPEWCWDLFDPSWYQEANASAPDTRGPVTAPTADELFALSGSEALRNLPPPVWEDFSGSTVRVFRGGSWYTPLGELKCWARDGLVPNLRVGFFGAFRTARSL